MQKKPSSHIWLLPGIITTLLIVLIFVSIFLFMKASDQNKKESSTKIAKLLADDIQSQIYSRVSALRILGLTSFSLDKESMQKLGEQVLSIKPYIFAFNLVETDGRIKFVYPETTNKAALFQNLLEHPEVSEYLLQAQRTKTATMSHRLMTYQGIEAFTLYVPIYRKEQFIGWLNAVIDVDRLIMDFIRKHGLEPHRIEIEWKHKVANPLEFGPKNIATTDIFQNEVLNQDVEIRIGLSETHTQETMMTYFRGLLLSAFFLIILTIIFLLRMTRATQKLITSYQNLSFKNNLLSSLTHDMASPLMVATHKADLLIGNTEEGKRVTTYLNHLIQMLKTARDLHASQMGILQLRLESVNFKHALAEAIDLQKQHLHDKHIKVDSSGLDPELIVIAEPNSLIYSVINNILSNGIKFSPTNASLTVQSVTTKREHKIIFLNAGGNFSDVQLENFKKNRSIPSTPGASGEAGTGLGLLQISSFMDYYGGHFYIENTSPTGSKYVLEFPR